jgi:hypothetical protein
MVQINVDPTPRYRQRRNSGWVSGVVRVLFFFGALIPSIIIAWRIDLINQRMPQVVMQQQPQQQVRTITVPLKRPVREVAPRTLQPAPVAVERAEAPAEVVEIKRWQPPADEAPTRPQQLIDLDLSRRTQRVPLSLEEPVRVVRVEGFRYDLQPKTGELTGDVQVILPGPREVTLSVELRSGSLIIAPTVLADTGKPVPFTTSNLKLIGSKAVNRGERAASELAALKDEAATLDNWVRSPGPQPLAARNRAIARVAQLKTLIPAAEQSVSGIAAEVQATKALLDFAERLQRDGSIVLEESRP